MNKVLSLTKVFLKNSFQTIETAKSNKQEKNKKSKTMLILYAFVFLYLAGIVGYFSFHILEILITIQQEQLFLGVILLGIGAFVLIQTIFSAISLLYYSKDNEYVLPLPIKPSQILMAKTNVLLITEYFIITIIGLIPLLIYGNMVGASLWYYISMIIVLLSFPIIPILISSILVLIVMSFSKFAKNKNRFQLIATIVMLVIVFGVSFGLSGTKGTDEEMIQALTKVNGFVEMIDGKVPTLGMAINSLTNNNILTSILNLVGILLITGVIYAIYIAIGQKLYLKGAVGNLSSGKKTNKKIDENKAFRKSSLAKTYIGKEFKILLRNPIFFMQCILPAVLIPVLMIGISILGIKEEGVESITAVTSAISDKTSFLLGAGILAVIQFFAMFMYVSVTAISRDGQNAVFMKYIPVPLNKQIEYKVMPNIIMIIVMEAITIIVAQYLFNMPIQYLLLISISAIFMGVLQSYLMIFVDLKKPKLEWNSEYAVVKQNMNLVWPAVWGIANIIFLISISTGKGGTTNGYMGIGIVTIIYLILIILVKAYIKRNETKLFEKIY